MENPETDRMGHTVRNTIVITVTVVVTLVVCGVVLKTVTSATSGCPAGTYKDVSYLTGDTFCGNIPPTTTPPTTSPLPAASPTTAAVPITTIPMVTVPNLVGESVWTAQNNAQYVNGDFNYGGGLNETCDGGSTDHITAQSPAPGTSVTNDYFSPGAGSIITLTGSCPSG